jgi:hypothetical protein
VEGGLQGAREGTRLIDANEYAALVRASVYTVTNCTDPVNCIPGTFSLPKSNYPRILTSAGRRCAKACARSWQEREVPNLTHKTVYSPILAWCRERIGIFMTAHCLQRVARVAPAHLH